MAGGGLGLGARRPPPTAPCLSVPRLCFLWLSKRGQRPLRQLWPSSPGGGRLPVCSGRGPGLQATPPWDPDGALGQRGTRTLPRRAQRGCLAEGNRESPHGLLGRSRQRPALCPGKAHPCLLGFWESWRLAQGGRPMVLGQLAAFYFSGPFGRVALRRAPV